MVKPTEGDGLTLARCEACGGLSLVILAHGEPIAFVCPPDAALIQLAEIIVESIIRTKPEMVQ